MLAHVLRVDAVDVRSRLNVSDVLGHYVIEVKQPPRGDWYGHACPRTYHRKSPRAFVIDPGLGLWTCFAGCVGRDGKPLGGDLFTFIAEREGLTLAGEDFGRVVAIAADIAGVELGVTLSPTERAARVNAWCEEMERRRCDEQERKRRHLAESVDRATAYYRALTTRSPGSGESYAEERGVLEAVNRGLIRFDRADHDSIALALRTSDGRVANVIRRRLPAFAATKDDRFRPLPGLWAQGTYINALNEIGPGSVVVIPEGFFDSVTAKLAWPLACVLGARSASDLPTIAKCAAPLVKRHGGRLLVAAHRDNAGFDAARAAIAEAHSAGLRLASGTIGVIKHPEADLNDSWRAGWRPPAWGTT